MVQLLASRWPGARLIAWPAYANSHKRRDTRGAEDAMRSFCSGYPGSILLGHGHITLPAHREGLTYRVLSTERGKSISLPYGEVKPEGGARGMGIAGLGNREGRR